MMLARERKFIAREAQMDGKLSKLKQPNQVGGASVNEIGVGAGESYPNKRSAS